MYGLGCNCSPGKCVKKKLISSQTLGYFSAVDLDQIFSKNFINLRTPQPGVFF